MALRSWPQNMWTLETHGGLHVAIRPNSDSLQSTYQPIDLVIGASPNQDAATTDTLVVPQDQGSLASLDHWLVRVPNAKRAEWWSAKDNAGTADNAIHVKTVAGTTAMDATLLFSIDGVRILILGPADDIDATAASSFGPIDVLAGNKPEQLALIAKELKPVRVCLGNTSAPDAAAQIAQDLGIDLPVQAVAHNTLAISKSAEQASETQVVSLGDAPWKMPDELSKLFQLMEQSCAKSQSVFAKLSTQQMNFAPANGTHTPRWNAEHMLGRQLLFFSQIYHAQDPAIPVMNWNPAQMPPDYRAAHPDWTGAEEALQMQRVSLFTRRFAYLLEDLDLDKKAPSSFWTPRALLKQMERHYDQHTANTIKKFELPGWPKS